MIISKDGSKHRKAPGLDLRMLCVLAAICTAVLSSTATAGSAPAIVTEDGPLKGIETNGIERFLGIPYAAVPVEKLRWTPPRPHGRWHGVLNATQFGNFCTQPDGSGGSFGSEDCLSLNVFRLAQKKNQNKHSGLAVMVWIHGGGFTTGGSALYDPTPLLKKGDVIVVTINYRLGFIGFFAHPALDAEGHLNANYGLMDQQLALGWVRRNIAAFGGDPNRVTIFGESAGGYSVYSNIASPTAAGLFHRAIAESGAIFLFHDYFPSIVPIATAETVGTVFVPAATAIASRIGCASQTAQCLRATAASTIVEAEPSLLYPIVDGTLLKQTLDSAFASGEVNHGPVIFGSNHDEWRFFVAFQYDLAGTPLTDPNYLAAVGALIGLPTSDPFIPFLANVAYPLSNYPPQPPGNQSAPLALGAMGTDFVFACGTLNADRLLSNHEPTYAYEFNDENAPPDLAGVSFPLGATHASELAYLFNFSAPFTPDQQQLSDTMIGYWTQFAKTGNPNSAGPPDWPLFNAATNEIQSLVPPTPGVELDFDVSHQCTSLWNTF